MRFGAHLPLIDFEGRGYKPGHLGAYAEAARDLGFAAVAANDHLVFQRPWLDGIVALASVVDRTGGMLLATTVSLPVVRGPAALAKAAAAIDILSGGRLALGVGPGSSARDYEAAGLPFDERWKRLDEAVRVLRAYLKDGEESFRGAWYSTDANLEPRPSRAGGTPVWIGSWGSEAGLRRVARLGDGWLASAYNTTPEEMQAARQRLAAMLASRGRDPASFPCSLATMWTYVTSNRAESERRRDALARMLNRPPEVLARQVAVGPPDECAALLRRYAEAGTDYVFVWPLAHDLGQLEAFAREVAPLV